MLEPRKLFGAMLFMLLFVTLNYQTKAQSGNFVVKNLKNTAKSIKISGLPQGPGFAAIDQCDVCFPFGSNKRMKAKSKEILANNPAESFLRFEEGKTYNLKVTSGGPIQGFLVLWHIQNANTDNPTVSFIPENPKLRRGSQEYPFTFTEATDGDMIAVTIMEDEIVHEHGDSRELILYIPINTDPGITQDMNIRGELAINDIGDLKIGGLPKLCNKPIASIIKKNGELSSKKRESLIKIISEETEKFHFIDADATGGKGYKFDFRLKTLNRNNRHRPKVVLSHYRKKADKSMILVSSKEANIDIQTINREEFISAILEFNPEFASKGDVLEIYFEYDRNKTSRTGRERDFRNFYLYLPVQIAGNLEAQSEIPILGTTLAPKIPYMILHDPPGDGSFSTFESGKSFCREMDFSLANTTSTSVNSAIKFGVAGSAGFIVTTDFEFSTTFSAGLEISTSQTTEATYETCVAITETIQTSSLDDVGNGFRDGDDLFIGYGTEMAYGIFSDALIYEGCELIESEALVFAPVGKPQQFILTERGVQEDISRLKDIIVAKAKGKAAIEAQNQIDVWEQVLQLNRENKQDESDLLKSVNLSGGNTLIVSEEVITKVSREVGMEFFMEVSAGMEFLLEAGGSGISGGVEVSTSQNFGASTKASSEESKLISYQLFDDDRDNRFSIDIFRDPMYGTPFFKLGLGSRTSCPFEGGSQIDAPKLFNGADCSNKSKDFNIVNAPLGEPIFAPLEICNESNLRRTYAVRLDGQSNPFGAVFELNGRNLNDISEGQIFTIPPNTCIKTSLNIWGNPRLPNQLKYDDIKLFIRPGTNSCVNDCDDEGVEDVVTVNILFGDKGGIDFCGNTNIPKRKNLSKAPDEALLSKSDLSDFSTGLQERTEMSLTLVPNPTGKFVNIHYELPVSSMTNIAILDLNGKVIREVVADQMLEAGKHSIGVQNLNMPSGMYLVRVQTIAESKVEQLVIVND